MRTNKEDKKAAIKAAFDAQEPVGMLEPLLISQSSRHFGAIADLAVELASKSNGLTKSLPTGIVASLASLVRAMNCYYSNLIEGHDTHPVDIERALNKDYSADPVKQNLQLEARAHIEVQEWIDDGGLPAAPTAGASILALHREFCERLPENMLWVENPDTGERVKMRAGSFRDQHVAVGQHVAISPGALPRFLEHFETAFSKPGQVNKIAAAATAHHRLLWMHPFFDGNGRVARLMSYAMLKEAINTGGIWSIARGLARNEQTYKKHLAACDQERQGDLDGRGHLSETNLAEFVIFFLQACLDQVEFMEQLIVPVRLRQRILLWAEEQARLDKLPLKSTMILEAILLRGELERGDVDAVLGTGKRQGRRITSALMEAGVITSASPRAPLHLAFPAALAERWLPGLFPAR